MKHKNLTRVIALLLTLLTVVSFAACGGGKEPAQTTTGAADATADVTQGTQEPTGPVLDEWGREVVEDDIPADLKFTGKTVNVLARLDTTGKNRWRLDFYTPEQTGQMLNDAVYFRNSTVYDRLDISFNVTERNGNYDNFSEYAGIIQNAYLAGGHEFDVVATYSLYGAQFATKGFFYNVNNITNYLNLDKVWWNQSLKEDLDIGGKLFFLVGDMNVTTLTRMLCIFFNKETVSSKLNDVDLYQVVEDGQWTVDYFAQLISDTYTDLNGNGKADNADFYGIVSISPSEAFDSMAAAMDVHMMVRDESGNWIMNPDTESLVNRVTKVSDLYFNNNNSSYFTDIDNTLRKFTADEACFDIITLDKCSESFLTEMKSSYGVLPLPKFDEDQEMYYTIPQDSFNLISVMGDVQDPDLIAAAMELLCAESYRSVTPKYYEEVLKYRYMRDDASGRMLDYLREGLRFDFATINTLSLGGAGQWFRGILSGSQGSASKSAASALKASSKAYAASLQKFIDAYEGLD